MMIPLFHDSLHQNAAQNAAQKQRPMIVGTGELPAVSDAPLATCGNIGVSARSFILSLDLVHFDAHTPVKDEFASSTSKAT